MQGCKPVRLEMRGNKSKRQLLWEAMRASRNGFTHYSLSKTTKISYRTTLNFLCALRKGGYVDWLEEREPVSNERLQRLVKDNGAEAPAIKRDGSVSVCRKSLATEAMWRTLRIIGETNADELARLASAAVPTTVNTARSYLYRLAKAGYLQVRQVGGQRARYRLIPARYSGPLPPKIQQDSVYDPNLGKVVWSKSREEEPV